MIGWLFRSAGAAAVTLAATASASGPGAALAACGSAKVGGATVLTWCGPAKATVKLGGKTLRVPGGKCEVTAGKWTLNVGRFTVPPAKPKFTYFGAVGTKWKAGTYAKGEYLVSVQTPGKSYSVVGGPVWGTPFTNVTIAAGGKKGTFSGKGRRHRPDGQRLLELLSRVGHDSLLRRPGAPV